MFLKGDDYDSTILAFRSGNDSSWRPRRFSELLELDDPGDGVCTGAGGCEGTYPRTLCINGCVSGGCNDDGNSAECCGHEYRYAAGFWDGQTCKGSTCGDIRVHLAQTNGKALQTTKVAANAPDDPFLNYHPARIMFIPNRCTHGYDVFLDGDAVTVSKEGM